MEEIAVHHPGSAEWAEAIHYATKLGDSAGHPVEVSL